MAVTLKKKSHIFLLLDQIRGRRRKEGGRRKKEEGRRRKEEGERKKEKVK